VFCSQAGGFPCSPKLNELESYIIIVFVYLFIIVQFIYLFMKKVFFLFCVLVLLVVVSCFFKIEVEV
jgi:hypothetical protein